MRDAASNLHLSRIDSIVITFLLTVLIWGFECGSLFFILSSNQFSEMQSGIIQGILQNFFQMIPTVHTMSDPSLQMIEKARYESFEIPMFVCAIVMAILSLNYWRKNSKK
jgi:hypothetical protein